MNGRADTSTQSRFEGSPFGSAIDLWRVTARGLANTCSCPNGRVQYEPMFVHMKRLPAKTADAIDLIIEFSTLGEYGLEYPESGQAPEPRSCELRDRPNPAASRRHDRRRSTACSAELTDFESALRPPRINLSFTD
jgi:hypothetical protein